MAKRQNTSLGGVIQGKVGAGRSDEELLQQFLAEVNRTFTIFQKHYYDYAVLETGVESEPEHFLAEVSRLLSLQDDPKLAPLTPGVRTPKSQAIDIPRLCRPLIVQAKGVTAREASVQRMLAEVRELLASRGRTLVVYPAQASLEFLGDSVARDLRSALKMTDIVPHQSIDTEISEAVCRSTRDLFEVQLKSSVQFVGASIRQPGKLREGVQTGYLELEGAGVYVAILLSVPVASLPIFSQRMTGRSELPEATVHSSTAEFVNIIGGGARGQLNSAGYALKSIGLPKTFGSDDQYGLSAVDSSTALEVRIRTDVCDATLELRFFA